MDIEMTQNCRRLGKKEAVSKLEEKERVFVIRIKFRRIEKKEDEDGILQKRWQKWKQKRTEKEENKKRDREEHTQNEEKEKK